MKNFHTVNTVDFETEPFHEGFNMSLKPPKPVGVSIKRGNRPSDYYAWGHPSENNCTWEEAKKALDDIWHAPLLFHNAKFDLAVAISHMGLPMPENHTWIHDTMYLLFLNDPYSTSLGLKPSAEALLDMPPLEQQELTAWIVNNTPCPNEKHAGAYIALAPGELVGKYAKGDTDRTYALWIKLYPEMRNKEMGLAYNREQLLMPITYYSEVRGVRVDTELLQSDLDHYENTLHKSECILRKKLGENVNFNKGAEVADALEKARIVDPKDWLLTPTGKRSTSKESLEHAIGKNDGEVLDLLTYRSALASALQTFARPWNELASYDGRIHTTWNQVRTYDDGKTDSRGSRTGRLSASKPSLMNVTNEIKIAVPDGLPPPPLMRKYLLPEEGHYWLKRDFSGQEIRVLAHFEQGSLMQAYTDNPNLDPHEKARQMVADITGKEFSRKDIKITAFGIIYGSGVRALSQQLGRSVQEASLIKEGFLRAMPGIKKLQRSTSDKGRSGKCILTWGGRMYYTEPSKIIRGQKMDFSYKLLNYLIQGSSADQTKECIINWNFNKPEHDTFLATVHDEINISAPIDTWKDSMRHLKCHMNMDMFDVPMRSEGFYGANWFNLSSCD
tara:strand:- start:10585 stop:12429 length:1845 start_codon:yes stop_codon:yes gene_type:complete